MTRYGVRYTERGERVLALAQNEARNLGHAHVGTEHILLGLLGETRGVAGRVLEHAGVSRAGVIEKVRYRAANRRRTLRGNLPFTRHTRALFARSHHLALQSGKPKVGTEHLLLALLEDQLCGATMVLLSLQVDLAELRRHILECLEPLELWVDGPLAGPMPNAPVTDRLEPGRQPESFNIHNL